MQTSPVLLDEQNQWLNVQLAYDEQYRIKTKITEVDPLFLRLLIAFEDKRFYQHFGIDPLALLRAFAQFCRSGRKISGGSTLTMQVARLLEKRPRTLGNKLLDMVNALQLETHFSKNDILEMYLNLAPYGGNIEGIKAATYTYFLKEPKALRPSEAALLAVLPQSPSRLRPEIFQKRARQFRDKLINRMVLKNILTLKQGKEAKEEGLPSRKYHFPKLAPHVMYSVRHTLAKDLPNPGQSYYRSSTLNKALQESTEKMLKQSLSFLEPAQTVAVIIVENGSRNIRSYVGSASFFDEKRKGQIDMITAIRSPGSTLKPFIYALGFDSQLIHPETIVQDVPQHFSGGYSPKNFQEVFHGEVTIREALQQSLNIPAVLVLEKIGPGKFKDWLNAFGIDLKFRDGNIKATLPLALGGVGMRLWDLVSLYSALPNKGNYADLNLLIDSSPKDLQAVSLKQQGIKVKSLVSERSAWLITHILEQTAAPQGFVDARFTHQSSFAYKTGTSYGYRDAWAIGYTPQYTIGVWVGRPDGTPCWNQTGRKTAAPILFKVLNLLPPSEKKEWGKLSEIAKAANNAPLEKLKYLGNRKQSNAKSLAKNGFSIQFPKEGSVVFLGSSKSVTEELRFKLKGGKAPYYVFINGTLLDKPFPTPNIIHWRPKDPGFVNFSAIDSEGHADSVNIEVRF